MNEDKDAGGVSPFTKVLAVAKERNAQVIELRQQVKDLEATNLKLTYALDLYKRAHVGDV